MKPFNIHEQEQPSWVDRASRAASMVMSVPCRAGMQLVVCDVGCGDMKLRQFLAGSGADYHGFDLVPQSSEVLPLDISKQGIPRQCDVAVLLGVVEYLDDLRSVLGRLRTSARYLVVSHVVGDHSDYAPEQLRKLGWATHLSRVDFEQLLRDADFRIEQSQLTTNGRTVLWLCRSMTAS